MSAPETNIEPLKVLLVEDEFEALNLVKSMLISMGITQIYTAKNGLEAMQFLGEFDCDDLINVILCDWNMPRMSGLELLKQIRTVDPNVPFLMITGTADITSVSEAKAAGVTAYIKKPFSQDELKKKLVILARILAHRQASELI